ncbi:MAG: deoxynucleoside kinase [Gemmatimonadetes bacterium]|nr:deoxynucleoside kinase [Gemmatimonadota bacterium]
MLIGFAGNCGTGKSTIAKEVARHYDGELILEKESANPYFADFIAGRKETALQAELAFLSNKLLDIDSANQNRMVVVDRVPDEDVHIFTPYWHEEGLLNETDFWLYTQVARQLVSAAPPLDVLIYLHGPIDLLVERISNREESAFNERVERMVRLLEPKYDSWIETVKVPVIRRHIEEHDYKGPGWKEDLAKLVDEIERFRFPLFSDDVRL